MFGIWKCYHPFNKTVSTFGDRFQRIGMITIMLASRLAASQPIPAVVQTTDHSQLAQRAVAVLICVVVTCLLCSLRSFCILIPGSS